MTEDHWTTNAISQDEDDRITAEEAQKSELDIIREALAILTKAHLRLELEVAALRGGTVKGEMECKIRS